MDYIHESMMHFTNNFHPISPAVLPVPGWWTGKGVPAAPPCGADAQDFSPGICQRDSKIAGVDCMQIDPKVYS